MAKGRVYIVKKLLFSIVFKICFTTRKSVEKQGLNSFNLAEAIKVIREYD